ncbi:MAG: hypothetical protein Q8922_15810 [Bacteroidota bacterium]|nr:hypothetical protein [Bacteroidota bacterium]MDP4232755.1 hypothetical protein [Bacteroidota bacterium]MDP4242563.1 hypothetical protein [Bacteroidota bacterium]MDP4289380.1 hypothetical protein [Bacteroidota bacterium]
MSELGFVRCAGLMGWPVPERKRAGEMPEDYWVSDESIIADFVSFGVVKDGDLACVEQLGIEVSGGDFV